MICVTIPSKMRAGDTIKWRDDSTTDVFGDDMTSTDWVVTYYLRTNTASEGATVVGTTYLTGWQFEIAGTTTANFDAGDWFLQAIATKIVETPTTIATGQFEVLAALKYAGTPGAYDGRSQIRKDLDTVESAIRTILDGGGIQEYRIGSRTAKKYDLSELIQLKAQLKAELVREEAAETMANGLGNPRAMFVRFH